MVLVQKHRIFVNSDLFLTKQEVPIANAIIIASLGIDELVHSCSQKKKKTERKDSLAMRVSCSTQSFPDRFPLPP